MAEGSVLGLPGEPRADKDGSFCGLRRWPPDGHVGRHGPGK